MSPQVVKDVFHHRLLMFAYTPSKSRWCNSMQFRKEFWGITRKFERAVLFLDVNPRLKSKQVKVSVFALNMALSTILPDFRMLNCTWILDTENEDLQTIVFFNYGCVIFPWLLTLSPSDIFRSMLKNSQSQSQHHESTVAFNKQATRIFTLTSSRSSPRCLKRGARRKSPQVGVVGRQEWTLGRNDPTLWYF